MIISATCSVGAFIHVIKPMRHLNTLLRWLSPAALDLAERLLAYDPTQRVTAVEALEAPYFKEEQPPPQLPVEYVFVFFKTLFELFNAFFFGSSLATLEGEWHELETKRERAKKRRKLENGLV